MTTAVLDACVLYPPSLRDFLMWLAAARTYAPRITDDIHGEWMRNVLADNPRLNPAILERTRRLMNQVAPDCVVTDYERHIPKLTLPDEHDRHVLAASIEAKAQLIVTFNLSDFPNAILRPHGVRAVHPDKFLFALVDRKPKLFILGVNAHRASLQNPPKSVENYVQTLSATGLRGLASIVEANSHYY